MYFVCINPNARPWFVYIIQSMHEGGSEVRGRPVIGLVADNRPASFGAWSDIDVCLVWSHYTSAIERAGGTALIAPPAAHLADEPDLLLDRIDGLLLTGGRDIDAASYGADAHAENDPGDVVRDRAEMALAKAALGCSVPLLGVCRGMQVLNLVAGGTLEQHLADPDRIHRADPGAFVSHAVDVEPGSKLGEIVGSDETEIRSHHHQGLAEIGAGLSVSARSADGVVEALEGGGDGYCLAVLWHPEEDLAGGGLAIYESLIRAASERKERVSE